MNILVDTQIWIWWVSADARLPKQAKVLISDARNRVFLSSVSIWEAAIKISRGKLRLGAPLSEFTDLSLFELMDFRPEHAFSYLELTDIHKDPFDRALVAQAKYERLALLTLNRTLMQYSTQANVVSV